MSDTKMLQAILDTVVFIKNDIKRIEEKVDSGFKKVNDRLEKRVKKIEKKIALT